MNGGVRPEADVDSYRLGVERKEAVSMKIGCHCGAVIRDQTDHIPYKARLTPDQGWTMVWDAFDSSLRSLQLVSLRLRQHQQRPSKFSMKPVHV